MAKGNLKDSKEKGLQQTTTKKRATRGKHITLHKYWKGIANGFINKADRRHYLNMMLDATATQIENQKRKTIDKPTDEA